MFKVISGQQINALTDVEFERALNSVGVQRQEGVSIADLRKRYIGFAQRVAADSGLKKDLKKFYKSGVPSGTAEVIALKMLVLFKKSRAGITGTLKSSASAVAVSTAAVSKKAPAGSAVLDMKILWSHLKIALGIASRDFKLADGTPIQLRKMPESVVKEKFRLWLEQNKEALKLVEALEYSSRSYTGTFPLFLADYLTGLKSLDISGDWMTDIGDGVSMLPSLEELKVWGRKVTSIPESLQHLKQLKSLKIISRSLRVIPYGLKECTSLERIELVVPNLESLPDIFNKLQALRLLRVCSDLMTELPLGVKECRNLQQIDLCLSQLKVVPEILGSLPLVTLQIDARKAAFPSILDRLQALVVLSLRVKSCPRLTLGQLDKLSSCDVWAGPYIVSKGDSTLETDAKIRAALGEQPKRKVDSNPKEIPKALEGVQGKKRKVSK